MNNQYPVTNFPLISPINPNPNPNFSNPQFNWAPPQTLIQNPINDLPNSISTLKTLIQSSISTLQSISSTFQSISPNSKTLIQCQSNPNHWIPSSSLFHHSLSCPSPIDLGRALETLNYPKTLKNDHNVIKSDKFLRPVDDPTSELCFSIDDFDCNFFYRDCPGVVSSLNNDASKRRFTLPVVLSVECGNFVGSVGFRESSVRVLPSEVWFVGREVEQWSYYPNVYSLSVCKGILCVECVKECDLSMWVIENSPRFGVVIDVHMRDHLCVLFRLCLKAMVREAACSYGSFLESLVDDKNRNYNPRSLSFNCPVLGEVSRWLTSHLSILYGEMNSRSFFMAMIRHLLSKAASCASLFPLDEKLDHAYCNEQATDVSRVQTSEKDTENETVFSKPVFVYQIAAAVAALYERSLLEERIRALRNPPRLTPYQRLSEHSHFSKKAEEERQKRPEYRPLIEHDSLLNQRQHDQGGNKSKTKEELLAEERDYKRRRMSYRGKKSKRSAKEVMRDIIEEYMDTIQHMGGNEDPSKGDSDGSVLISTNSSALPATSSEFHNGSRTDRQADNTLLDNDYNYHDTKAIHTARRVEQRKKESYSHGRFDDQRITSRDRRDRDYDTRSPTKDIRHGSTEHRRHSRSQAREKSVDYDSRSPSKDRKHRSREHRGHSRNQAHEKSVDYDSRSPSKNRKRRSREHRGHTRNQAHEKTVDERSKSNYYSSGRKDKWKLDSPGRQRRQHDSLESIEMNDRYDPSETSNL